MKRALLAGMARRAPTVGSARGGTGGSLRLLLVLAALAREVAAANATAALGPCAPVAQRVCAATANVSGGVAAQLAASWCESTNPFVYQRPLTTPSGAAIRPRCAVAAADGTEGLDDPCAALAAVATAEVEVNCSTSAMAEGTRGLLCAGGEARVSLAVQLLGTADGELLVVDAPSQAVGTRAAVRVLPPGRALSVLHAVSLRPMGRAAQHRNSSSPAGVAVVLAGDATTLRAYVVHAAEGDGTGGSGEGGGVGEEGGGGGGGGEGGSGGSGGGFGGASLSVASCEADGGATLVDAAAEGLLLRAVSVGSPVADGTAALAALVLERITPSAGAARGASEHEVRTYWLRVGGPSRCGLPATVEALASGRVTSDAAARPLRVQLLGSPPAAHAPVRSQGAGDAAGTAGTAAVDALSNAVGFGDDGDGSAGGGDDDGGASSPRCGARELMLLSDTRSIHVLRPCAIRAGETIELRTSAAERSRSLVHMAEDGVRLTATTAFFEHFERPRRRVASATGGGCVAHDATRLAGCAGVANCSAERVGARFCDALDVESAASAEAACPDGSKGGVKGDRGGSVALLWLVVAKATAEPREASGRAGGAGGAATLQLVPLPEVGRWWVHGDEAEDATPEADDGLAALPTARCGLPSEDAGRHVNTYWARVVEDGGGDEVVVCEARRALEVALPTAAVEVAARFRRLAQLGASGVSGKRGVLSGAAERPCDMLLGNPVLSILHASCTRRAEALAGGGGTQSESAFVHSLEGVGVSESQRLALRTALHHAIFVRLSEHDAEADAAAVGDRSATSVAGGVSFSGRASRMLLFGAQERLFTSWGVLLEPLNSLTVPGAASSMHVSANGLYAWLVVSRARWELASVRRGVELCAAFRARPEDPFLSRMGLDEACGGGQGRVGGMGGQAMGGSDELPLFGWESTACPPGALCPSFVSESVYPATLIASGLHIDRAYTFSRCPVGSFCVGGQQLPCPPGYSCGEVGMAAPARCSSDDGAGASRSCFDEQRQSGVVTPRPCADERVCVVPYVPGLPLPPGFARVNASAGGDAGDDASRGVVVRCHLGEWCPLGRATAGRGEELSCPAATYCSHPSVLTPTPCNFTAARTVFCPAGTHVERVCPAGHVCMRPDAVRACAPRSFCPAGTLFEAPCPAGRYCPNASAALLCPAGSTCPEGSLRPRACFFLTSCPAGSSAEVLSLRAPLIVLLAALLVVGYGCTSRRRGRSFAWPLRGLRRAAVDSGGGGSSTRREAGRDGVELRTGAGRSYTPFADEAAATEEGDKEVEGSEAERAAASEVAAVASSEDSAAAATASRGVQVAFHEVSVRLRQSGRTVLQRACGELRRGELTAVMGPSGSGKTTLLTALSGRVAHHGVVRVDGVVARGGLSGALGGAFAFVPQEDVMYRRLTVEENVWLSAAFRLARGASRDGGTAAAVRRVLGWMRLEHVQHAAVGDEEVRGVSGGERKRVNIALELVAQPACLFVDEPTSGLDAAAAKEVVECIRQITLREGLTVACVVHQPRHEVVVAFDALLLLARGGRIVYAGAPLAASGMYAPLGLQLPEMCSLSDFLLDVVSDAGNEEAMTQLWRARVEAAARTGGSGDAEECTGEDGDERRGEEGVDRDGVDVAVRRGKEVERRDEWMRRWRPASRSSVNAGPLRQVALCTVLHFKLRYRRVGTPLLEVLLVAVLAVLLGLRYAGREFVGPLPEIVQQSCPIRLRIFCSLPQKDVINERLVLTAVMLSLLGVMSGAAFFSRDAAVVRRYHSWGVSMATYAVCGLLVHALEIVVAPLVFCGVNGQWASFLSTGEEIYAVAFGVYWASSGLGNLIIMCVGAAHQARIVGPMVVLVNFVISPAATTLPTLPPFVLPLTRFSYLRWAMESGYLMEIRHWASLYDTASALSFYGYDDANLSYGIGFIMCVGLVARLLMVATFGHFVARRGRVLA